MSGSTDGPARARPATWGERLARLVYVLIWLGVATVVVALAREAWTAAKTGVSPFAGRVDPDTGTAGLLVETDRGTGCQYIVTPWGGIVPRTGADGRQLCPPKG